MTGGKGGGGTQVTNYGHQLIAAFKTLAAEHQEFLGHLSRRMEIFEHIYQLMRNLNMLTSARNQFLATITSIKQDSPHVKVVLQLNGNDQIVAMITAKYCFRLTHSRRGPDGRDFQSRSSVISGEKIRRRPS